MAKGVFSKCDDTYSARKSHPYLQNGFQNFETENPSQLMPFKQIKDHDGKFYLDVVVTSDRGFTLDWGHASLRLTSASGDVYSAGLSYFPGDDSDDIFVIQAKVCSPDSREFHPKKVRQEKIKRYEIATAKDFQNLIQIVESEIQKVADTDNAASLYHRTQQNCAHFCKRVVDRSKKELNMKNSDYLLVSLCKKIRTVVFMFFANLAIWVVALFSPVKYQENQKKHADEIQTSQNLLPLCLL